MNHAKLQGLYSVLVDDEKAHAFVHFFFFCVSDPYVWRCQILMFFAQLPETCFRFFNENAANPMNPTIERFFFQKEEPNLNQGSWRMRRHFFFGTSSILVFGFWFPTIPFKGFQETHHPKRLAVQPGIGATNMVKGPVERDAKLSLQTSRGTWNTKFPFPSCSFFFFEHKSMLWICFTSY